MNNDTINDLFGKRLKKLRDDRGLYQEDIGEWFQMRKSTVSQWESGRLTHASVIAQLARKFNVSTDYLLGLSDRKRQVEAIAAHRTDDPMCDLPPEAEERVQEFIELMRMKYGNKK